MSFTKLKKAMILAAGYGTRLRPITDSKPKALVEYGGLPLLEHVLQKLEETGIEEVVINTHYLAEQVSEFVSKRKSKVKINLIYEKEILGTGGAIANARKYLEDEKNILIHNVDVISDFSITEFYKFHLSNNSDVSLAVNKRDTLRPLLVNSEGLVIGMKKRNGDEIVVKKSLQISEIAFCGVHIISENVLEKFSEVHFFGIIEFYMKLIKAGHRIDTFDMGDSKWSDLGKDINLVS